MNRVKKYYLAPTWDNPPITGQIGIGNVIIKPKQPVPPLFKSTIVLDPNLTTQMEQKDVEYTHDKLRGGSFGIYTKFLEMILGLGVDLDVEVSRGIDEVYKFQKLQTQEYWPDEQYITEVLKNKNVVRHLDRQTWSKEIFIVIGIKSVSGASAKSKSHTEVNVTADFGVDGTVISGGVPISGGIKGGPKRKDVTGVSFGGSSDFVFAYRVLRVKVKKEGFQAEEYAKGPKGSMYGDNKAMQQSDYTVDEYDDPDDAENWSTVNEDGEDVLVSA